jgi:hypothetical protein
MVQLGAKLKKFRFANIETGGKDWGTEVERVANFRDPLGPHCPWHQLLRRQREGRRGRRRRVEGRRRVAHSIGSVAREDQAAAGHCVQDLAEGEGRRRPSSRGESVASDSCLANP